MSQEPINPEQVPKYPVYHLTLEELDEATTASERDRVRVTLDGVRVEPAAGQDPKDAAIAATAQKAADHDRAAVRVVVKTPTGDRWDMIVTREGEAIDITADDDSATAPERRSRKRRLILITSCVAAGVVMGGSVAAAVAFMGEKDQRTTEQAEDTWQVPGADVQVPMGLPEGYAAQATWSVPVTEGTGARELSNGDLVIIDAEGRMTGLSADEARPQWRASSSPRDLSQVVETTWEGNTVLAQVNQRTLRIWPIPEAPTAEAVEPESIELPASAEVSYGGDSPLIYLGDYVVLASDGAGGLTEVTIPAGTIPLSVVGSEVVSMDDQRLYRTPITTTSAAEQPEATTVDLSHHSAAADYKPEHVWPVSSEVAVGLYENRDGDPLIQAFDVESGKRIAARNVEDAPDQRDPVLVDLDAETAVIGTLAVQWTEETPLAEIEALNQPVLHAQTVWGNTNDGPAFIDLSNAGTTHYYEVLAEDDTAPVLHTDDAAYLEAPRVKDSILYRVDAETGNEDSAEPPEAGTPGADQDDDSDE